MAAHVQFICDEILLICVAFQKYILVSVFKKELFQLNQIMGLKLKPIWI